MMLGIIERWLNFYFLKSQYILGIFLLIDVIIIVQGLVILRSDIRYIIYRVINKILCCVVIATIGILLNNIGISLEIKYDYFNIMFFSFSIVSILLYEIIQCIIFKSIKEPLLQGLKNIQYIIFFMIFLLAITSRLSLIEWCTGTSLFLCIQLIILEIDKVTKEEKIKHSAESDYPNSDLYYTRSKQLDYFIPILQQQRDEPYAVMISGEWGVGKSSFLQAVEEKLPEDNFVWIHAGSELKVSDIMTQISDKILEILRKNSIFIEKDSVVEKYFLAFAGAVGESKLKIFNSLSKIMGLDKEYWSKDYLNSKLSKLKTMIYLVIDDLDRCDIEYQEKMFKVIRESTDLTNCKTIFVVDQDKFLSTKDCKGIEKYVTYTLELCKVEYDEIASYLIDNFFDKIFWDEINPILSKNRNTNELQKEIYEFPLKVIEILKKEKTKIEDESRYKQDLEKELYKQKIEDIEKLLELIRKNITISRKVKKYFKDIKYNLSNLNLKIDACDQEYRSEDWILAVLKVQFIKHFLPDEYVEIKKYGTLHEYGKHYKGHSIPLILSLKYRFLLSNGNMEDVLNWIIYKIDIINFEEVKTKNHKYYKEMYDCKKATIKHVNEYLACVKDYKDLYRILEICNKEEFDDNEKRLEFIKNIIQIMSHGSTQFKADNEEFLIFSKDLVNYFKTENLSKKERNIVITEGHQVLRRVIVDNTNLLRNVLDIVFKVTNVEKEWENFSVTDIDELCRMLSSLDKNSIYGEFRNDGNELSQLIKYYENLHMELAKEQYQKTGLDFETIFKQIHIIFEICTFWADIEKRIVDEKMSGDTAIDKYFTLEGVYSFNYKIFNDENVLINALKELKKFYELKRTSYESNFSLLLLRVLYNSILIFEQKPQWYVSKKNEINGLFTQLAKIVYELDKGDDKYSKDAIEKIKIYTYKFNQYCKESEKI